MIRIGHGFDLHQYESYEGDGIILAGVNIPYHQCIKAHSDGDVVYHSVIDAILGALALGDIGQWFPDTDSAHEGVASDTMLAKVMEAVFDKGYVIGNIDVTVIAQRPKLAEYILQMRENLAEHIHATLKQVSIKAKTHEKVDAIGEERAIAAHAVVLLTPKA